MDKQLFVVGSDPEFMLTNVRGELVSAVRRVPGTKESPKKVPGGAIQRDNVLAEINTDPATSVAEFVENFGKVIRETAKIVAPLRLTPLAGADFPKRALRSPEAKLFGCDPDFNAWLNKYGMVDVNQVPADAASLPFRSAGGHLHIGYTDKTQPMLEDDFGKISVVQLLDVFTGFYGILVDDDVSRVVRRTLYGKAGAHRPKAYGVEYRSLSNFWLRSPKLIERICSLAEIAVNEAFEGRTKEIVEACGGPRVIQDIINHNQVEQARACFTGPLVGLLPEAVLADVVAAAPMQDLAPRNFYETWEINL